MMELNMLENGRITIWKTMAAFSTPAERNMLENGRMVKGKAMAFFISPMETMSLEDILKVIQLEFLKDSQVQMSS